ncbi:DEAD/DEAH box helicase [Trinickia symbiotica]|uniref:DEAD/DEAH box helicase n=1 Tax=Trinickia symbiotica TaxID=863227 RepID=UPI0015E73742|nr:AAA domain-containing protein [Trinickia symbiotica]
MTIQKISRILDYWHSVEFFNSYSLDDQLDEARDANRKTVCVRSTSTGSIHGWDEVSGQSGELYLVPFDVVQATSVVEHTVAARSKARSVIDQIRDEEMAPEGLTCFAKVKLGQSGRVNADSLSVSALPWALGRLQSGALEDLCAEAFEASLIALREDLTTLVAEDQPFDAKQLVAMVRRLHEWARYTPLSDGLAWMVISPVRAQPAEAQTRPKDESITAAQSTDASSKAQQEEDEKRDLPILNSFYLHDLMQAQRELDGPRVPRALKTYLSLQDASKLDLDAPDGQRTILETLRPRNGIGGRWPSPVGHFQALMQQYALNRMKTLGEGEIVAVNGPPGTGKTTLLRDLIAHLVVERARVLASLDGVKAGLSSATIEAVFAGGKSHTLPVLSPMLTGFEVVVASSNNGAVENLSLELPQSRHLDSAQRETLGYFKPIATRYAGSHATRAWKAPEEPVWGLVSAALGKRANRTRFGDVFSNRAAKPDDRPDRFLSNGEVDFPSWDAVGAMTYWRYREKTRGARPGFRAMQERFNTAHAAWQAEHGRLEALDAALNELDAKWANVTQRCPDLLRPDTDEATLDRLDRLMRELERETELIERRLGPSFMRWLSRWFRPDLYRRWCETAEAAFSLRVVCDRLRTVRSLLEQTGVTVWQGTELAEEVCQARAFWQSDKLNGLRNELFSTAMALHEAFFHEAQTNDLIFALSRMLSRPPVGEARKILWQWFFMLVPVVSSTFASFRRQFAGIGPEDLGWLIVDEAGQAVPQAAVGAIMRARRVVVVGDPLQIEPVVTQSTRLLMRLGEYWLQERRPRYAVDVHSVQTLADRCYPHGVRHPLERDQFIGIPLVMHRRCATPMFEIANAIAYDGRMKHAKKGKPSAHCVLGHSAWWHVAGDSRDGTKYIVAQGQRVFEALVRLYIEAPDLTDAERPQLPDAFVITPFRQVKQGLIALLGDHEAWRAALSGTGRRAPDKLGEWIKKRVGTVHTFQGKESEVVFFVLGCDVEQTGAIDWAAAAPNLLNVAVTRAKSYLYVIGDCHLWGGRQYFDTALAMLGESPRQVGKPAPADADIHAG